jgi:hypothetical protein
MRHATEESPDDAIRAVIARLARPHESGGVVIERAAIMAEGGRSGAILDWIQCHAGEAETAEPPAPPRGLHAGTGFGGAAPTRRGPARYVLPAGALSPD